MPVEGGTGPVVIIRPPGEESTIDGAPVGKLTPAQFAILKALAEACTRRLSAKELRKESKKKNADAILRYLLKRKTTWGKIVSMGGTGDGYGLFENVIVTVVES